MFRQVDHAADLAINISASSLEDLFIEAVNALHKVMNVALAPASTLQHRSIELSAPDTETLLVDWLHEFLFIIETEELAAMDWQISSISSTSICCSSNFVNLESLDFLVKAVTFHNLRIVESDEGYQTEIVFDV